jgi:hypothetical protein
MIVDGRLMIFELPERQPKIQSAFQNQQSSIINPFHVLGTATCSL